MKDIQIVEASKNDLPAILELVKNLAAYERVPDGVKASLEDYSEALESGSIFCLVAKDLEGRIIGMALYYYCFSTWMGKAMYLEDFYVLESHRRTGIGELLFDRFLLESRTKGCKMVRWQVLDWNEPAINFYKKKAAGFDSSWINGFIYL